MFVCYNSSFILGSHDEDDGPQLYMVDPSGISYVRCSFCLKQSLNGLMLTNINVMSIVYRVTGAVPLEKPSKQQKQKLRNFRWVCVCVYVFEILIQ